MTYFEPVSVHFDRWVAPDACDDQGFLRPGKAFEWMDAAGELAATRFAGAPVTTVAVDGLAVRKRVTVGERAAVQARVLDASDRSISVAITMSAGRSPLLDASVTFTTAREAHGMLFAGTLMRWLESCAARAAADFFASPPRLLGIDGLEFLRPVAASAYVQLEAIVAYRDEISLTVMVQARERTRAPSLRGFFTYAPLYPIVEIPELARTGAVVVRA